MYEIKFHQEAKSELLELDGSVKKLILKKIVAISKNPMLGQDLGNRANINLTGFKKVYVDSKKYRIVYKIVNEQILIYIISIGKRENLKVYQEAFKRLNDLKGE